MRMKGGVRGRGGMSVGYRGMSVSYRVMSVGYGGKGGECQRQGPGEWERREDSETPLVTSWVVRGV